jgi:acetyl-CoA carboxylase carboxyl transferase subunit alpha
VEYMGPYSAEKKFGPGSILVIRHFGDLRPVDLWPESAKFPHREIWIMTVYQNMAFRTTPWVACHGIFEGNTQKQLVAWAAKADDRFISTKEELERIEKQIQQLEMVAGDNQDARRNLQQLQNQVNVLRSQVMAYMGPWQRTELARHLQRPHMTDWVKNLFTDFSEIHGDRAFGDDPALICGMARFHGEEVLVVGQHKGNDTKERVARNFGQAHPEGYRKALRAMRLAEKFHRPIICFVDTTGAYPGLGAEERGQAEAIARNLREMARLEVPVVIIIAGEGGSGGALAIAIGDRVLMLENAIYSVISPEGCASIMWRDSAKRQEAARALKITATDLEELGLIDVIVPEPPGGAQTDHAAAAALLDTVMAQTLNELRGLSPKELVEKRYDKFRYMTQFFVES